MCPSNAAMIDKCQSPEAVRELCTLIGYVVRQRSIEPDCVGKLAIAMGVPLRTLQRRCKQAGTTAKACLDFVRCARVILDGHSWDPQDVLLTQGLDDRTVRRLLRSAAFEIGERPTMLVFLQSQQFVLGQTVLSQLESELGSSSDDQDFRTAIPPRRPLDVADWSRRARRFDGASASA
jgi:hypothetical protein